MPTLEEQLGLGKLGLRSAPRLRSFFDDQQDQAEPPAQPDITTQPRKFTLEEPETDDFRAALADRLKTLPPEDIETNPHGALQYALDILDLPRNVVANLINTVVQAEPASKERAFGLRRVGTSDILRKIGLSAGDSLGTPGKVADAVIGFIGDVATDPLTYLTLGTSGLAGSAARRIGGQTLKHAAAPKVAQLAEDLIASGKIAAEQLPDAQKAIAQAGTKVGSAYGEQAVRTAAEKQAAEQIAREAPELVDKNVLGLTTRGLKEFRPGSLPYALGTIIPRTIAPEAVGKIDDIIDKIPDAIRRPFGFLPEKDVSLVTTDTAKAISDKLGLGKLGEQIAASPIGRTVAPYAAAAKNAAENIGTATSREIQKLFSNEPVPALPGDADDAIRYEAQKLEQFNREYVATKLRDIAQTEPKKIRAMISGVMKETGLPETAINQAAIELIERLPSSFESLDNIAIQIKRIAGEAKGTDAQAEQVARFIPDTPEQIAARAAAEEQRKQWTQAPGQLAAEPPPLPKAPSVADFAPRQGPQTARDYTPIDQLVKQVLLEARGEKLSDGTLKRRVFALMPGTAMDGRATQSDWLNATGHAIGTNKATEIIADARKRVGYEVRQSVHDQAKAELAAFEREQFKGLGKKEIAQAKRGPQYKALKGRVTSYLARAATEHTAEEVRAATERARAGDIDDMTLLYAPVDELPRPVADLIKADADNQLEFLRKFQHKYPGRITALAKIARGGGEDTGAAVIAEKERIIRRLRGAMDDADFTPEMRTWGIPGPPEDPLFRLVGENDAARRGEIVADALRATEEGEPNELVNAAYKYLGQGLKREPTQDETLDFLAKWGGGDAAQTPQVTGVTPQVTPGTPQQPTGLQGAETPAGPQLTIDLPPNRPGRPGTLTVQDDMQQLINYAEQRSKARIEEARGYPLMPSPELTTKRELGYYPRIWLGDAKDNFFALIRKGGMKLRSRFQNMREDVFREHTTIEANRIVDGLNAALADPNYPVDLKKIANGDAKLFEQLESLQLQPGDRLEKFSTDAALAHTYRELEHARTIGNADFFTTLAQAFGTRIDPGTKVPPGLERVNAGRVGQFGGILADYAFPVAVKQIIDKHIISLEDPNHALRAWRAVQGSWKGFALMAPGYHVANMFGNVWNSRLLDAWSERAFNDARRVQKAIARAKGAPSVGTELQGTGLTYEHFWQEMVRRGVVGSGFFGVEGPGSADKLREILEDIDKPATIAKAIADAKAGKLITANQTIGKIGEEASRLSFIIERTRKGDTMDEAVAKMKAALFDYRDLTGFEAGTSTHPGLRDAIPFYAWTKNNSKLLYYMAVTNPAKLATVPKLQLSLESAFAGDETLPPSMRPPHILEEGGAQVSGGASPRFINLGRMLPVGEFKYNPLRPGQAITNMVENVAGPFKTAYELATNRDQFFDRDILEYPGQRKEFLGANIDPRLKHVLRTIRPLNLAEQVRTGIDNAPDPVTGAATAAAQLGGIRAFGVEASRQVYEAEKKFNDQLGAVRRDMKRRLQSITDSGGDPAGDSELARMAGIHEQIKSKRDALPRGEARAISRPLSQRRRQMLDEYMQAYRTPQPAAAGV